MNDNVYLTPNLYLKENHLYYTCDDNKEIKLNHHNWHKYMTDYDYEKLSRGWKSRLRSSISPRNSPWGIKDCGGDGDCLFLCIEEAFKNFYEPEEDFYSVTSLREIASERVTRDNYQIILETYKAEQECGEFDGFWDPSNITNLLELQNEIKKCGNSFWGDHIIIQLLSEALKLNFIILNDDNEFSQYKYSLQQTCSNLQMDRRTIILSYYSNCHYQLVGYFNGQRMQTVFNYEELPKEILQVYQEDCK